MMLLNSRQDNLSETTGREALPMWQPKLGWGLVALVLGVIGLLGLLFRHDIVALLVGLISFEVIG
jgi:hypothetical protein